MTTADRASGIEYLAQLPTQPTIRGIGIGIRVPVAVRVDRCIERAFEHKRAIAHV
ncbi:hypothetical protein [Burkholderia lata]|uniref:hypothetical protein n=1 Tax=Burkholderia lata (strain ATCC 17760 / DSM 23089 / LMG 22485 / NCIMB 9086 / R18194 / 383) TaxID=482957 RepID=UPI0015833BB6|nr:hypothetical protein [Burkholderia lata]